MRGPTNSTDLVSAAALNTQWNVPRKETMKIHTCLFFVSMVASSRQLTCETNLGRPGKLANFSIANKRGRTESWTSSATDFLGCYSRIDVNAALLDSLKLNLTSFTRVHVADYFNLTLTAVRLLKPFLYIIFEDECTFGFLCDTTWPDFMLKLQKNDSAVPLLKNPLTSQWIVAPPPSAWPSRSVLLCTPATTSPNSSSTARLTIGRVGRPASPLVHLPHPPHATGILQMPVAAAVRLINEITGGGQISKWTASLW